jgi:hypothetical protein
MLGCAISGVKDASALTVRLRGSASAAKRRDAERVAPPSTRVARGDSSPARTIDQLFEENGQLRALVVQLSEIVVRNVLYQNPPDFASTVDGKIGRLR